MKTKSVKLEVTPGNKVETPYIRLGKHAFLLNNSLLVVFAAIDSGYTPQLYEVAPVSKSNLAGNYSEQVKKRFTKIHDKILSKLTSATAEAPAADEEK